MGKKDVKAPKVDKADKKSKKEAPKVEAPAAPVKVGTSPLLQASSESRDTGYGWMDNISISWV